MNTVYVVCYSYGGGCISGEWGRYPDRLSAGRAMETCREHYRDLGCSVWIEVG